MRTGIGDRDERIIWQSRFLSSDYLPQRVIGRDEQKQKLETCLSPMKDGQQPLNAWLYGPAGTGKTVLARVAAAEACQDRSRRFAFYVNCWERRSLYSAVQAIVESMKILGAEAQDTNVKLDRIRQVIRERPVVIILDDIDRVAPSERERIIYAFLGLPRAGVLCISNQKETLLSLEERTRSRLSPVGISFPRYRQKQLEEILFDRAREGLVPYTWSRRLLSQLGQRAGGDARAAIQGLRRAAVAAESRGQKKLKGIGLPDVNAAPLATKRERLERSFSYHERLIYELASRHQPVMSTELRRAYHRACSARSLLPVARRTFSKYLKALRDAGLLSIDQRSLGEKGRLVRLCAG